MLNYQLSQKLKLIENDEFNHLIKILTKLTLKKKKEKERKEKLSHISMR
jgi:ATP adenylyltransferase/5',5'''-P-1,P-4-tetraphosphate phosphorylase II